MANPIFCMLIRPFMRNINAKKLAAGKNELNESRYVSINGMEQWITIRGRNKNNPVILILHGGPGSTYTPFNVFLLDWEKYFTIVQWDQTGSGKTFKKNGIADNLSFSKLADDGIELAKYICAYLNCKKIILMGSLIGLKMIKKSPEHFTAYIGAEQNSPDTGLFYKILKEYTWKNDKQTFKFLEKIGNGKNKWTKEDVDRVNKISVKVDKNAPHMIYDLMLPAIMYDKGYSMKDIQTMSKGMEYALEKLYAEMVNFYFEGLGYQFKIPFFIFQGEYDIFRKFYKLSGRQTRTNKNDRVSNNGRWIVFGRTASNGIRRISPGVYRQKDGWPDKSDITHSAGVCIPANRKDIAIG